MSSPTGQAGDAPSAAGVRLRFDSAAGFTAAIVAGTLLAGIGLLGVIELVDAETVDGVARLGLLLLALVLFNIAFWLVNGAIGIVWTFDTQTRTLRVERWVFRRPTVLSSHPLSALRVVDETPPGYPPPRDERDVGIDAEASDAANGHFPGDDDAWHFTGPRHLIIKIGEQTIDLGPVGEDAYEDVCRAIDAAHTDSDAEDHQTG